MTWREFFDPLGRLIQVSGIPAGNFEGSVQNQNLVKMHLSLSLLAMEDWNLKRFHPNQICLCSMKNWARLFRRRIEKTIIPYLKNPHCTFGFNITDGGMNKLWMRFPGKDDEPGDNGLFFDRFNPDDQKKSKKK